MSANTVSLYRQINSNLIKKAGIEVLPAKISYIDNENNLKEFDFEWNDELSKQFIEMNKYLEEWSPRDNSLKYIQSFVIKKPSELFGEDKVTDISNSIGLAAHLHSKESRFQKTYPCKKFIESSDEEITLSLEMNFAEASLKTMVYIDFFFYLAELNVENMFQANEVGMKLSQENILEVALVIDGEGATFPITEVDDPNGPLWTVEKNWTDPSVDIFNSTNVQLRLNRKHPHFDRVTKGNTKVAQELMKNILVDAMGEIIYQSLEDMKEIDPDFNLENLDTDISETSEGTILKAVNYWITTYDIDEKNLNIMTIFNTLRRNLEGNFVDEEGEND